MPSAVFADAPETEATRHRLASEFPRRVLLAVSGLSPQIVTETVYALAVQRDVAFVPTEIHLITTQEGRQRAALSLFSSDRHWFGRLCADYKLPPIAFNADHLHVITDAQGQPLRDIRSPADNQAAADFITQQVRHFTSDPDTALHVSIAGGRKTLGFYLGYALSLYARAQDEMSHVLVSEPFENSIDFFYPTPYSHTLQTRNGGLADTATAEVTLATIPYVSLRHGLPAALLSGRASFNDTVAAARTALAPPRLVLDHRRHRIMAGQQRIELTSTETAFLALFIRALLHGELRLPAPNKWVADADWGQRYALELQRCGKFNHDPQPGLTGEDVSVLKTRLNQKLQRALGPAAAHYQIQSSRTRQPTYYSLNLLCADVCFDDLP